MSLSLTAVSTAEKLEFMSAALVVLPAENEFGTDNVPDADSSKFRSYEYDATNLEEFVGFSVKIVMKSKDTTMPCAIKAFRGLALA